MSASPSSASRKATCIPCAALACILRSSPTPSGIIFEEEAVTSEEKEVDADSGIDGRQPQTHEIDAWNRNRRMRSSARFVIFWLHVLHH